MPSLWDALSVPPTRIPIDVSVFALYILPLLVCYLAAAVLAIIPQTHTARVALWPIFVLLALRAAFSVSISNGRNELRILDGCFTCTLFVLSARTLEWAFEKRPLVRQLRPANSSPSIIMDALDLTINLRGCGWNWSRGFPFPQDTRPKNRFAFVLYVALSAIGHLLMFGIFQRVVLSLHNPKVPITEFVLFDESLPLLAQYIRASTVLAMHFSLGYSSSQAVYDIGTLVGVLIFGQEPAQWPPIFDAPWRARSVTEFWGRRWHQWFRHIFLFLGGRPCSKFLGRPGVVIGGFLASALMHSALAIGTGDRESAKNAALAFAIMFPAGLAERLFYRLTGRKVGGIAGAIWTVAWLLVSGTRVAEGWTRAAMGDESLIDGVWLLRTPVECLVKGFNAMLRAI